MTRRGMLTKLAVSVAALSVLSVLGLAAFTSMRAQANAENATETATPVPAHAAGHQVFLDEKGNRTAPPADYVPPAPPSVKPKGFSQIKTPVEGGGWKMNVSHIRAYNVATIDESGKVTTSCDTHHGAAKQ